MTVKKVTSDLNFIDKKSKNQARGKKAQEYGDAFEYMLKKSAYREGILPTHIKSKAFLMGRLVHLKQPFDFVFWYNGKAVAIDAKTCDEKTFISSKLNGDQTDELHKVGRHSAAGLIIWFRPINAVMFFSWEQCRTCFKGQSLRPEDGIYLGKSTAFTLKPIFSWHPPIEVDSLELE